MLTVYQISQRNKTPRHSCFADCLTARRDATDTVSCQRGFPITEAANCIYSVRRAAKRPVLTKDDIIRIVYPRWAVHHRVKSTQSSTDFVFFIYSFSTSLYYKTGSTASITLYSLLYFSYGIFCSIKGKGCRPTFSARMFYGYRRFYALSTLRL